MKRFLNTAILLIALFALTQVRMQSQSEYPGETPPAGYNDACEASPILYYHFGTYCLHPVYWDIPGFYPIGSAIAFQNPETGQADIGRVTSYYWDMNIQRYVYQALWLPSSDPLKRRYALVAPEALLQLP